MSIAIFLILFIVLMLVKFPIPFTMLISSLVYYHMEGMALTSVINRLVGGVDNFVLLSVPGFILAGIIMNSGGITERIFKFADLCVGWIPGGLGHANVFASVIFAGMSGTAVADAAGLGAIELKAMQDAGFDEDFSLAVTGASSIIGPIIPPSVPMVLYATMSGASVGAMFMAGVVPGILMGLACSIIVFFQCKKRGYKRNPFPKMAELGRTFLWAFFPLLTPVIIIGGILTGVFTPTESAMIAVLYSVVLAFIYRAITIRDFPRILKETLDSLVPITFIVSCAAVFGYVLAAAQTPAMLAEAFLGIIDSKLVALIVLNILLLLLGCFMETTAAILIFTPVILPILTEFDISLVHFGVLMVLNLMIGLLTPPVGVVLYVLAGISEKASFSDIVKVIWPYIIVLIILLYVILFIPQIATAVPAALGYI
ncbi:MAG: TRAP transporter large permease [Eubacteriales bacterium]